MRRRALHAVAVAAAGCGRWSRRPLLGVPPETTGQRRRPALAALDRQSAPDPILSLKPEQWIRTAYSDGARVAGAPAFAFSMEAAAFELHQQWDRGSGGATYREKAVPAVCRLDSEPVRELIAFARRWEQEWP